MQKLVLLGDEAIAQGAIDAGLSGIYAYPGTPSTEITEYVRLPPKPVRKVFTANGRPMRKQQWRLPWEWHMPEREQWYV